MSAEEPINTETMYTYVENTMHEKYLIASLTDSQKATKRKTLPLAQISVQGVTSCSTEFKFLNAPSKLYAEEAIHVMWKSTHPTSLNMCNTA